MTKLGNHTIRKNIESLNSTEKRDLVHAFRELQKTDGRSLSKYDKYIIWHVYAMTSMVSSGGNLAHQGPVFLPWHREFLKRLELDLQEIVPDISLPYCDWTNDFGNPNNSIVWSNELFGGNGDPLYRHPSLFFEPSQDMGYVVTTGPFKYNPDDPTAYSMPSFDEELNLRFDKNGNLIRQPLLRAFRECIVTLRYAFPNFPDIQRLFNIHEYDSPDFFLHNEDSNPSFRNSLEGWFTLETGRLQSRIHNAIHVWISGTMQTAYSPGDPIFFLNHANVDRIWAEWQKTDEHSYPPDGSIIDNNGEPITGQNRSDEMYPWNTYPWISNDLVGPTIESTLDHHLLGYKYDTEI